MFKYFMGDKLYTSGTTRKEKKNAKLNNKYGTMKNKEEKNGGI